MKPGHLNTIAICLTVYMLFFQNALNAQTASQLVFDAPATHFTEAAPLGNGRLGAMVFGGTTRDRIVLNEISMWSGGVENPNRPDAYQYLGAIQQLLKEEKNKEAQQLLQKHFISAGKGSGHGKGANAKFGCYQILSDLFISWQDTASAVTAYRRILDLDKALATTTWQRNNVIYTQEVIVSAPQQAIIVKLKASKPGALSFSLAMNRKEAASFSSAANSITMQGQLNGGDGDKGIKFAGLARVISTTGKVTAQNNGLNVQNATQCIIVIGAATDLNWPVVEQRGPDPLIVVQRQVEAAAKLQWPVLLKNHQADFQSYYNRAAVNFTTPLNDSIKNLNTPKRLERYAAGGADRDLPLLYFNFGRYLLISSSRPGNLPANLQGLWAEEYQTPWNGDYHMNINVQMNYWPAELTNLAECHKPLIDFVQQLVKPGMKTAHDYYRAPGWVAHVITNPWKFTAPGEGASWGSTLTGGAWLCAHLWQHYQFNPDKEYLRKIYPVLKGASQFYTSILIEDPKTKWLVTAPSNSPENTYITPDGFAGQITMGPAMDMQLGRELLGNTIAAASLLNIDETWTDSLQQVKLRLAPNQVSPSSGRIQEWLRDYKEAEPQHRHVSHLYGLHPYDEISQSDAPLLAEAARKTLLGRGDSGTGWSMAWKINFWARLGDGDHALKMLKGLLKPAFILGTNYTKAGGTYPNLFCAHPPFQIDGNFGATAAIAEMLLQSTGKNNVIRFLPALPQATAWSSGKATGLCAVNGFETEFKWAGGKLLNALIHSKAGKICFVEVPSGMHIYDKAGKLVNAANSTEDIYSFATHAGEKYSIR